MLKYTIPVIRSQTRQSSSGPPINNIWSDGKGRDAAEANQPFLSKSANPKDTRYFKPPQSKASGVDEKHDISQVNEEHPAVRPSSDLVYPVRTGEFVPYDDPREPGDCGYNEYHLRRDAESSLRPTVKRVMINNDP
ncbi:hypothetical protein F4814DRAFT_444293 [Daldinia grandis]|nr:hypothetical protein F4814DRAFT_444293 [Daldinia grandis]